MKKQFHNLQALSALLAASIVMVPGFVVSQTNSDHFDSIQKQAKPRKVPAASSEPAVTDQAMIDEINAIRKQLGGGIAELLDGLDLNSDWKRKLHLSGNGPVGGNGSAKAQLPPDGIATELKADFDHELKRLAAGQIPKLPSPSPAIINGLVIPNSNIGRIGAQGPAPHLVRQTHYGLPIREKLSPTRQLRHSARQLDEITASLEDAGLFKQADQIRQQAGKFWLKARELEALSQDH